MNILCISTYFKGQAFLIRAHELGHQVFLVTDKNLEHKAWPHGAIKEKYYLEKIDNVSSTYDALIAGVAVILQKTAIDVVVALDDFDVEKAALVRETFRINGMGQSTARFFRDKLAMRIQAKDSKIPVPAFCSLFVDIQITEFLQNNPGPWLIKPRSEASATGIKKVNTLEEAWEVIHTLGANRHQYLIETFKPGDVFHVDALIFNNEVLFEQSSVYLNTPLEVSHGGGIFRSVSVSYNSDLDQRLKKINRDIIKAFRMKNGVVHTEVIKNAETGELYFLETASRVGGAHLAEQVEAATKINLWSEWASIESAVFENKTYKIPQREKYYSGILVTLSSHEWPNYGIFNDPEIQWTMSEAYHIGLIVRSKSQEKVLELLNSYVKKIYENGLHASAPVPDKPSH